MNEKEKNLLIRISQELSDDISTWADKSDLSKSAFVRKAVRHYIETLSGENPEVFELIKGIIITKIDRIQSSYNEGNIIAFTHMVRVSTMLGCYLCKDAEENEYIVYNIHQSKDESMLDAIQQYAMKLYRLWRHLSEADKKHFLVDLQLNQVYFSIQVDA